MALASCPDCAGKVSTSARSCPHCGHPGPFAAAHAYAAVGPSPQPWATHGSPALPQPAAAPPQQLECPLCRMKATSRAFCPRCDERLAPAQYLPPHHFPRTPVDYAGFGSRFGALLIDGMVMMPLVAVVVWLQTRSPAGAIIAALLGGLVSNGYEIVLHAMRGQTVGKRVMDIQVRNADGTPIGFEESLVRYLPYLVNSAVSTLGTLLAASVLTQTDFDFAGGISARLRLVSGAAPGWTGIVSVLLAFFWLADVIVFFTNRRRRALHDVIAGTVVVHV